MRLPRPLTIFLIGIAGQLSRCLELIPLDTPNIHDLPNQVIFRRIGSVSPVLNFVHLRETVHLTTLDAMVDQLCKFLEIMDKLAHFDRRTGPTILSRMS